MPGGIDNRSGHIGGGGVAMGDHEEDENDVQLEAFEDRRKKIEAQNAKLDEEEDAAKKSSAAAEPAVLQSGNAADATAAASLGEFDDLFGESDSDSD